MLYMKNHHFQNHRSLNTSTMGLHKVSDELNWGNSKVTELPLDDLGNQYLR